MLTKCRTAAHRGTTVLEQQADACGKGTKRRQREAPTMYPPNRPNKKITYLFQP